MSADTYADRAREFAKVTRAVAEAVHEGGVRTGYQKAAAEVRVAVLTEVVVAIRAEARRARGGRSSVAATNYADGLLRAAAVVQELAQGPPPDASPGRLPGGRAKPAQGYWPRRGTALQIVSDVLAPYGLEGRARTIVD